MTFAAAVLSALAALVLKLETLVKSDGAKKDLAALLSVAAALSITISTSGDFQRKWQANRIAAAELEHTGYEFLEKEGADARSYLLPSDRSCCAGTWRSSAAPSRARRRKRRQNPPAPGK